MSPIASQTLAFDGARAGEPESRAGEAELVARARTSPQAFARLYRLHYPAIARYVRRRVGDEHEANDLVAETFAVALEHLPRYRERGLPFRAWLYRLASSRLSRWVRRQPRTRFEPLGEADLPARPEGRDEALDELARRALLSLPSRYQTTLALHYLEGLTVEEIAQALGTRVGTIKARLSRGRARLRRRLRPHAEELLS